MIFEIHAERSATDKKIFFYDNEKNVLKDSDGNTYQSTNSKKFSNKLPVIPFDKENPIKKSNKIKLLKIQMGLSCNYSCDYCSQKFVERAAETNPKDVPNFMAMMENLDLSEEMGLKIEFWGGEPFVYWKTMKPLAEALRAKFAHWKTPPKFSVITNGSLLTEDICAWLYAMGFSVAISHDGPGQSVRGPDPFEDPKKKEVALDLYNVLKPLNRMSFNSMLNAKNISRKEIYDWFVDFTGDNRVIVGEGGFVDAYDEDGLDNSLSTKKSHFNFRQLAFNDMNDMIKEGNGFFGFGSIKQKKDSFVRNVLNHNESKFLGQKCGMDDEHTLAVDLRGNVTTCQNVSSLELSKNGESHLGGTMDKLEEVQLTSSTHWMNRPDCAGCPVLHICQGACMFLDGKYWDASCKNAYSDAIAIFAIAFKEITDGYVPFLINNETLPLDRQDIWGVLYEHKEEPKRKIIPIKVVSDKMTIVNDIEVYEQSKVIEGETQ
jgi:uncharacterized protein